MGDRAKSGSGSDSHLSLLRSEHVKLQTAMGALQRKYDVLAAASGYTFHDSVPRHRAAYTGSPSSDSFVGRLLGLVAGLFENADYSDIRISLDGHSIPAHRFVLAARSEHWGVDSLAAADTLQFGNLSYSIGHTMLKWVYTDDLSGNLGDSLVLDLMKAANHFTLPALFKRCETMLMSRLDVGNCVSVYSAASEIEATALADKCAALISAHWEELGPEDLASMSAQLLYKILRSKVTHPLHAAIRLRREDVLFLYLIEFHSTLELSLNAVDAKGQLPLALALGTGQLGMAKTLLSHGADRDAKDARGDTVLFRALTDADSLAAHFLLQEGADTAACLDRETARGPLHILAAMDEARFGAASQAHQEAPPLQDILELLLSRPDAQPNAADKLGMTPLHCAVAAGNSAALSCLLKAPGLEMEAAEAEGRSALWLALSAADASLLVPKHLVSKGADVNFRNVKSGDSLIHETVRSGNVPATTFLVEHKANVDAPNSKGWTALHLACDADAAELALLLLGAGASADAQSLDGDSAIHLAARKAKPELIRRLITEAPSVNLGLVNGAGWTALGEALLGARLEAAEALVAGGASPNAEDSEGRSLLLAAIRRADDQAALWLIAKGANAGAKESSGLSCLQVAVAGGLIDVVGALCAAGADMNVRDAEGLPPLWAALDQGSETLASVLVQHGCDRDAWGPGPSGSRQTLLHRAIDENNESAATFLVRSICDVNAVRLPGEDGAGAEEGAEKATPLHMAAAWGLDDVAATLVDFGADVNAPDAEGRSPVHVAVINHQESILKRLLQTPNVALSLRDRRSQTPFAAAMSVQNNKAAQAILERQPTVAHQVDGKGYNFLHTAVRNGDLESVLFLIGAQMDVNILTADAAALSPVHLAATAGHEMILRNLILAGVHLGARTKGGETALHLAAEEDAAALVSVLLSHGLDPNILDNRGNNPLHIAVQRGSLATVRVLLEESPVHADAVNVKGQTVLHLLGRQGGQNAAAIFEALLEARPKFPVDALDADGNSMLLLAYMGGNAQLCKAAVESGVCLGTPNLDGVTIFSHQTPTKQLLFRLLDQLSREPKWAEGDFCSDCGGKFSLTTRKHHCRHCGRLLCAKCSESTTPIIKYDLQKAVRVCDVCYDVLTLGAAT